MTGLRVAVGAIVTLIVIVALVPMIVLLDLAGGGDGLGICPEGLGSCRTSYFDGPELLAVLLVLIFLLLVVLRAVLHMQRQIETRRRAAALDPVSGGRDRLQD
jgi:hypothetical protein